MNYTNDQSGQMNPFNKEFEKVIKQRGIDYLIHFTKSSNLPFILGNDDTRNGIISSDKVAELFGSSSVWDKKRLDNHPDYVCCSVQRLNTSYYQRRYKEEERKGDIFNQWAVLFINPAIINSTSLFCPVNAATGNGRYIKPGVETFESLFKDPIEVQKYNKTYRRKRPNNFPANLTTDYQAEVLIKDRIPKEALLGVAFPDDSVRVERERLNFWSTQDIPVLNWRDCNEGNDTING